MKKPCINQPYNTKFLTNRKVQGLDHYAQIRKSGKSDEERGAK